MPAQYDASKPTAVMVFQDGNGYQSETASFWVPIVFDNLIHKEVNADRLLSFEPFPSQPNTFVRAALVMATTPGCLRRRSAEIA